MAKVLLLHFVVIAAASAATPDQIVWEAQTNLLFALLDEKFDETQKLEFKKEPPQSTNELIDFICNNWVITKPGQPIVILFRKNKVHSFDKMAFLLSRAYLDFLNGKRLSIKDLIHTYSIRPKRLPRESIILK